MRSQFVRQEWEYALALGRGEFVRPVYWDDPIPEDSTLGLPPRALRALHFSKLAVDVAPPLAVDVAPPSAPPAAPASLPEAPADPAASRMSRPGPLLIRITIAIVVALVVIALVVTLLRWPG